MATKNDTRLALKALLHELQERSLDVNELVDSSILHMHQKKMFITHDPIKDRAGAQSILLELLEETLGGKKRMVMPTSSSVEEF